MARSCGEQLELRRARRARAVQPVLDAALDAPHLAQPAHVHDVGRFARPWRDRAESSLSCVVPGGRALCSRYSMPRSTRRTWLSPHTCTMSVALLDHGEIVPRAA